MSPFQRLRQKLNRGMFTIKAECQVSLRQIPPVNRTAAKRTRRAGGRSTIRKRRLSCFGRFSATRAANMSARSEEHTSELQSLMRISYAVFCLKKKKKNNNSMH